jgi:hypothetical protein
MTLQATSAPPEDQSCPLWRIISHPESTLWVFCVSIRTTPLEHSPPWRRGASSAAHLSPEFDAATNDVLCHSVEIPRVHIQLLQQLAVAPDQEGPAAPEGGKRRAPLQWARAAPTETVPRCELAASDISWPAKPNKRSVPADRNAPFQCLQEPSLKSIGYT